MARSKALPPVAKSWMPPSRDLADIMALKAFAAGTANAEQQKRAYDYILLELSSTNKWPYDHESERDTHIAMGRQYVGQWILKFVHNPPELFVKRQETGNE